ncbi:MAG: serine protease [Pseudonocardia sp.]|nr:serine protease [Pseudonocardia sp.]
MPRSRPATVAILTLATFCTTLLAAGTAQAAPPGDQPPPVNATERAAVLTRPAVVRIAMDFTMVFEDPTGTLLTSPADFTFSGSCTGVGVNPNGYVATAGHCVDNTTAEGVIGTVLQEAARQIVAADPTRTPEEVIDFALKNWTVRGATPGSPVDRKVMVGTGSLDAGNRPTIRPAEVIGYKSLTSGDVALLKIDVKDLPTVPLATDADVRIGTEVLSIGFPGSADEATDPTFEPSNKDGRISSKKTMGGVPFYETSASMSQGMSGGPTVDMQGRLVGINSWGPVGETAEINFMTAADTLSAFMASNGVRSEAGRVDTMFRTAVDAYYAGHYTDAIAGFAAVLAAVPGHPQATQMRVAALGAREKYGDVPQAPVGSGLPFGLTPLAFWSIVGGGGALVLLTVLLVIHRVRRRRRAVVLPPVPPPYGLPFGPPTGPGPYAPFGPYGMPQPWSAGPPPWQPAPYASSGNTTPMATALLTDVAPCRGCGATPRPPQK